MWNKQNTFIIIKHSYSLPVAGWIKEKCKVKLHFIIETFCLDTPGANLNSQLLACVQLWSLLSLVSRIIATFVSSFINGDQLERKSIFSRGLNTLFTTVVQRFHWNSKHIENFEYYPRDSSMGVGIFNHIKSNSPFFCSASYRWLHHQCRTQVAVSWKKKLQRIHWIVCSNKAIFNVTYITRDLLTGLWGIYQGKNFPIKSRVAKVTS